MIEMHRTQKEITQEWLVIHPNSVHLSRAGLFSRREGLPQELAQAQGEHGGAEDEDMTAKRILVLQKGNGKETTMSYAHPLDAHMEKLLRDLKDRGFVIVKRKD